MTELSDLPLAEIRRRLAATHSPRLRAVMARELGVDPRRGARALAASLLRREEAREAERARISALFARRAQLTAAGARYVAGVDEVGVGPLAGPVVAAAVILGDPLDLDRLGGLNDSKLTTRTVRESLAVEIREQALSCSIAEVSSEDVDRMNIYRAALEAMRRAVVGLDPQPDHVLVDARTIPRIAMAQTALPHGDAIDGSISAASIVAKVYRDAIMRRLGERHPGYGFDRHMGYGTPQHLDALGRLGPTPFHRRSFAPVARTIAR